MTGTEFMATSNQGKLLCNLKGSLLGAVLQGPQKAEPQSLSAPCLVPFSVFLALIQPL